MSCSTAATHRPGGVPAVVDAIESLAASHSKLSALYGSGNEGRLTGTHAAGSIETFSSGAADRQASVHAPLLVHLAGKGYSKDRRQTGEEM
jgi:glutamine synthetase